ncbi:MAG TPA: UbiX family flavin prenyltransferase, partial [Alphaproteobacteria bacterium]|nr:UbiX family flavin prenyltransferase [Alphaproteobacteria bacterium]
MRLIIGMTGASGLIYGIRLLEVLKTVDDVETHLVLSPVARMNITLETDWAVKDVEALADVLHKASDIGAPIASGSFRTAGMIIAPCSIKTLSGVANSYSDNLIVRA